MTPRPARYLLRVDDLCPTVHRAAWERLAELIGRFGLRPILAVVPDNCDRELRISAPDEGFWDKIRQMRQAGASIGLHGYRHGSVSRGGGLLPVHDCSEFAGAPPLSQRTWIRAGLGVLRSHGLDPALWVAPRHGFDRNTLAALREEGISILSDGFARVPYLREGMIWIPQQLWAPAVKQEGLWTICLHPNSMTARQMGDLAAFLGGHASSFISVEEALTAFRPAPFSMVQRLEEKLAIARLRLRRVAHARRGISLLRRSGSETPPPGPSLRSADGDRSLQADRARR